MLVGGLEKGGTGPFRTQFRRVTTALYIPSLLNELQGKRAGTLAFHLSKIFPRSLFLEKLINHSRLNCPSGASCKALRILACLVVSKE